MLNLLFLLVGCGNPEVHTDNDPSHSTEIPATDAYKLTEAIEESEYLAKTAIESPSRKYRDFLSEYSHPFAVALVEWFEQVPSEDVYGDNSSFGENDVISDTSAFFIDLDGNGTIGVAAYKAFGTRDFIRVFYMLGNEIRTLNFGGAGKWFHLSEIYEAPLIYLFGGEGAGDNYVVFSLKQEGMIATASFRAAVGGIYFYYPAGWDGSPIDVSREEFDTLFDSYGINNSTRVNFSRKSHYILSYGYVRRDSPDLNRHCNTLEILTMTIS